MGRLYPIRDDDDEEEEEEEEDEEDEEKQTNLSREHAVLVYTDHV